MRSTMASKKPKKPAAKGPRRKSKKKQKRGLLLPAAVFAICIAAVGGYMFHQANPSFSSSVKDKAGQARDYLTSLIPGSDNRVEVEAPRDRLPGDRQPAADSDTPVKDMPVPIPRQQTRPGKAKLAPVTVKQAQRLAVRLFGGKVVRSLTRPGAEWYEFVLQDTARRQPYDVTPKTVFVASTALAGTFVKGVNGFAVPIRVEDPSGPQWTSAYLGATLFAGTPPKPGKVLGSTAMQAPQGDVSRIEAIDFQPDGVLELALEVESAGPGGFLFRDLAVHSFGKGRTRALFTTRTLEDGPGVPLDVAEYKDVGFGDVDGDGALDIVVEEGKRHYRVHDDMTRTLTGETVVRTRTYRMSRGKFKVARK